MRIGASTLPAINLSLSQQRSEAVLAAKSTAETRLYGSVVAGPNFWDGSTPEGDTWSTGSQSPVRMASHALAVETLIDRLEELQLQKQADFPRDPAAEHSPAEAGVSSSEGSPARVSSGSVTPEKLVDRDPFVAVESQPDNTLEHLLPGGADRGTADATVGANPAESGQCSLARSKLACTQGDLRLPAQRELSPLEALLERVPALASSILKYSGRNTLVLPRVSKSLYRVLMTESIACRGYREAVLRHARQFDNIRTMTGEWVLKGLLDSASNKNGNQWLAFLVGLKDIECSKEKRLDLVKLGLVKLQDVSKIDVMLWAAAPSFASAMAAGLIPYDEWLEYAENCYAFKRQLRHCPEHQSREIARKAAQWYADFWDRFFVDRNGKKLDRTKLDTTIADLEAALYMYAGGYPKEGVKRWKRGEDWVPRHCKLASITRPKPAASWYYVLACAVRERGRAHPELYVVGHESAVDSHQQSRALLPVSAAPFIGTVTTPVEPASAELLSAMPLPAEILPAEPPSTTAPVAQAPVPVEPVVLPTGSRRFKPERQCIFCTIV